MPDRRGGPVAPQLRREIKTSKLEVIEFAAFDFCK